MATKKIGIQGETLPLYFDYTIDGTPLEDIEEGVIGEIEFQILDEGAKGALRLTKSGGRIAIDSGVGGSGKYMATLTQQETFALPQTVRYQIRIKDGDDVIADDIGVFTLGKALSKTVLTNS